MANNLEYLVIIEKTDTGYSAYVPDLPGCITVGNTQQEIKDNIQQAILLHLEGMQEDGIEIPMPSTQAVTMPISRTA
jgi:predicted RNase H-like HicB family nuclease